MQVNSKLEERKVPFTKVPDINFLHGYLKIGGKLGEGTFGVVLEVTEKSNNKKFAMKIINKTQAGRINLANIYREIGILKLVNHPNIIHLEKVFESPDQIFILLEKCCEDLATFAKKRNYKFKEFEVKTIISNLVSAVAYLHRNDIIHRDLKPENILMAGNPYECNAKLNIKLIDFGLSIVKNVASYNDMLRGACGTLAYMAPELFNNKAYSQQCDVWAIGVITYLLLEGEFPFPAKDADALADLYRDCDMSILKFKSSSEAVHVVTKMLTKNPALRITAAEIMHHPWLVGDDNGQAKNDNILDMMKMWRSDLKLPVGEQCDWMIEMPAQANLSQPPEAKPSSDSRRQAMRQLPNLNNKTGFVQGRTAEGNGPNMRSFDTVKTEDTQKHSGVFFRAAPTKNASAAENP